MAVLVETKDCTALSDSELTEMADLCAEGPIQYEAGLLSKQADEWVLVSLAREGNKLKGFAFSTLERIGGTPSVVVGVASIRRVAKRDTLLRQVMADLYHRAGMAFPAADRLVAVQMVEPCAYDAFKGLSDICPRPEYRPSGEERAWGRRLAKRFSLAKYDDRAFVATGDGSIPLVFDFSGTKDPDPDIAAQFTALETDRGDCLIAFGWAMAEDLLKHT